MGIVSRWRTQRQLGEPQWNPSQAHAAGLGERRATAVPGGPHDHHQPTSHHHAQRLETEEEVKETSAHTDARVCRCTACV